jgi:hypothetical protein
VPIRHPITRKLQGVLNLTARYDDANLRQLVDGMPRRTEASQRELINWLVKHRPHPIDDL